ELLHRLRCQLDLLAVQPSIGRHQDRLPRLEKIALAAQKLAEDGELEGARLIRALHEGEAVALGRRALLAVDDGAGEPDAARYTTREQRLKIGGARHAQSLEAALVGGQRMRGKIEADGGEFLLQA